MTAVWPQTFHDLQPDAQQVVRACAVFGHPSLSLVVAAAVVDSSVDQAAEMLGWVDENSWGVVTGDRFEIAAEARPYLRELARWTSEADVRLVVDKVAAALTHAAQIDTAMTPSIRTDVINVLRTAARNRRPEVAIQVARAAWRTLTPQTDLEWCRKLAEHGEHAAINSRQPDLFVELLDLSAHVYSAARDWPGAERAWLRALAVVEDLGDTTRFAHFLEQLATTYRNWNRPHKAADTLHEIMIIRQRGNDSVKTAEALAAVGTVMFDAGRSDAALHYLGKANRLLRDLSDHTPDTRPCWATVLIDLGRVHATNGSLNSARTYYHQALTLVLDIDESLTQRVRALQAALPPT